MLPRPPFGIAPIKTPRCLHPVPHPSQRTPAEWSGAPRLVEKWLARHCMVESFLNFAGGAVFFALGLVGLVFTSCLTAGITLFVLVAANWLLAGVGVSVTLVRPGLFAGLFLLFLGLSTVRAYRTRWGTDAAADVDLGSALSSFRSLGWEFLSVGPMLLVLAGQDFYRYVRLSRLDVPQVSALLLWLYDKGGRARFAEICLAFPGLNAVRVLPQLSDLPGINWWPEDAEVSLSENVRKAFAQILGREPKSSPHAGSSSGGRQHFQEPVSEVDKDIIAWYAALHLPLFAPLQRVKAQYRKLAKIHHPDTRSGSPGGGETSDDEQMKRINEAYHNILKHSRQQAGAPR
jgi:hypothetical protein